MLKQEIPMPVAIGIIVVVLLVVGFFVYRSLFAPAPTVSGIPEFQPPPPSATAPPSPGAPAPSNDPTRAPINPPPGYGAPR
ncbi:hypothetical protein HRbin15_00685 [bacterium HR15]|nr:hypothetical protein HRbin15_00685 [bacterium HR15]